MQKIYTLLTSSYNGTVTMHTSAVSFFDRGLAEETKAATESVNESAYFRVHCQIEESELVTSRDEVDLLNPEVAAKRKAEITANGDLWREKKNYTRGLTPRVVLKSREV